MANDFWSGYGGAGGMGVAPAAPEQPQGGGGVLHGLYDAFIGAPLRTVKELPGDVYHNVKGAGIAVGSMLKGEHGEALQKSKARALAETRKTGFKENFSDAALAGPASKQLEGIAGHAVSNVANVAPFAPTKGALTLAKLGKQGAAIGGLAGAGQAMENGGSLEDIVGGTATGAGLGYAGARVTGGLLNRLTKGKAFPSGLTEDGKLPPTKVGGALANAGTDLEARAGGYGIGEGRAGRTLGFYDSAAIGKNLRDEGIGPGTPDSKLKRVEDKMYGLTQTMDKILVDHNAPVDAQSLAQEYLAAVDSQPGVNDSVRRSAQNFARNLARQVRDVRSLVDFRRGLDKQSMNFSKNPDSKMAADEIASRVLRDLANDHTNTTLPELAKANQSYHNLATASEFLRGGAKVLSDQSQSGGGLYSRLVTGKTAQGAKSFAGAGMRRIGKLLGGDVPGEVAQSRAAQAVASLPEDHPLIAELGPSRVVTQEVPLQATDLRPGADELVSQVNPVTPHPTTIAATNSMVGPNHINLRGMAPQPKPEAPYAPPVDLRTNPTRQVQTVVPGEPVAAAPSPVAPEVVPEASQMATSASSLMGRLGGQIGGNLTSSGQQPMDMQGGDMGGDTSGGGSSQMGQEQQSPYGLENLEYDMSRDPAHSSTYMALYKMLNPNGNLSATMQRDLANVNSANNIVDQLEKAFDTAGGGEGRVAGSVSNLLGKGGLSNKVQVYNSIRAGSASKIARALGETGVLTDQDISRALGYLPNITDNPAESQQKLAFLRSVIAGAKQSIESRSQQGSSSSSDMSSLMAQ